MRLLDRLIRGVLMICIILLGGYILVRTVTIAGENGMFQDSPVLSALYRKLENASLEIYIPAFSYQSEASEAASERDLTDLVNRSLYPAVYWLREQQEEEGQEEEYELILAAEARAEEEKKPLDLQQWMEERQRQKESQNEIQHETQYETQQLTEENQGNEETETVTEGNQEAEFETLLNRYFSMDAATTIDSVV